MDKRFEVALPEEVLAHFGWKEAETPRKLRELVIMELLRHDRLSEAEAADLLQIDRWELLELMGRYRIPAIRMSQEELREELTRKLTPGKRV
jgi:hypothetical protein